MQHERCCIKMLHVMIKTYSFALACCFWILFDLDWSWWHCCCRCCSGSCSCSCGWSCSWFSCCSGPSSWSSSRFSRSRWSLSCSGCWSGSLSSSLSSSRSGSKTCCQYRLRRRNNHFNIIILERQTSKHCKQKNKVVLVLGWFGFEVGLVRLSRDSPQNWVLLKVEFYPKSSLGLSPTVWPKTGFGQTTSPTDC